MAKLSVIIPVDDPMDWVSSVVFTWKESGELHLCSDPHDLNNAIHRYHHCTPTVDEVAHEFTHFRYFPNLDGMHTRQLFLTPNPGCSPLSTLHLVDITSYASPLL